VFKAGGDLGYIQLTIGFIIGNILTSLLFIKLYYKEEILSPYDYQLKPLPSDVAADVIEEPDRIFPYFIIQELPVGLSGLLIASIFATGISTMDSVLAALSQTFLTGIYQPLRGKKADAIEIMRVSRIGITPPDFWPHDGQIPLER